MEPKYSNRYRYYIAFQITSKTLTFPLCSNSNEMKWNDEMKLKTTNMDHEFEKKKKKKKKKKPSRESIMYTIANFQNFENKINKTLPLHCIAFEPSWSQHCFEHIIIYEWTNWSLKNAVDKEIDCTKLGNFQGPTDPRRGGPINQ